MMHKFHGDMAPKINTMPTSFGRGGGGKHTSMVFVKMSHDTRKYHKCCFLECKEDLLESMFGEIFDMNPLKTD